MSTLKAPDFSLRSSCEASTERILEIIPYRTEERGGGCLPVLLLLVLITSYSVGSSTIIPFSAIGQIEFISVFILSSLDTGKTHLFVMYTSSRNYKTHITRVITVL